MNNIDEFNHEYLLLNESIFWSEKLLNLIIKKGKSTNFSKIFSKQTNWSSDFIHKLSNYLLKINNERNSTKVYLGVGYKRTESLFSDIKIPLNLDILKQLGFISGGVWKHINLILNEELMEYLITHHNDEDLRYYLSENKFLNWDYNSLCKMLPYLDNFKLSKKKKISILILPFLNEEIVNSILHFGELKIRKYTPWCEGDD